MKKIIFIFFLLLFCNPILVEAKRGCCSHHGGVSGCGTNGRVICNDGTYSPTCTCTPSAPTQTTPAYRYGCTDPNAFNYDASATKDNGKCVARIYGCQNYYAINFNSSANTTDGSCKFEKYEKEIVPVNYKKQEKAGKTYKVIQAGKQGTKEVTKKQIYDESNNIISTEVMEEIMLEEPVSEIVLNIPDISIAFITIESEENTIVGIAIFVTLIGISYIAYRKQKQPHTVLN